MKLGVIIGLILFCMTSVVAQVPQIWSDYISDKRNGNVPELTDFSYAGYHFSEVPIPGLDEWTYFTVTDYGAIADDDLYDDEAIQMTIDAAQAHDGPSVVFFPSGRFMVSEDNDITKKLSISRDSIVLKGSGSGSGGTEIFMDEMRVNNGHWQFSFVPSSTSTSVLTYLVGSASRGDYSIVVENSAALAVGEVIYLSHESEDFARAHFGDLGLSINWTRLFGVNEGMTLYEIHEILDIDGNVVTFKNPIQTDLPELSEKYALRMLPHIREVGVEDILFTSNWVNYGEDFVHHKDDIHDYAWNAMQFKYVRNGWVRNCEFRDWNQVLDVRESVGVTVENLIISGKKGHASVLSRRSYGLLTKDCVDEAGHHHGPGFGYSGVNTVYLRHEMQPDQSVDSHSGQPYANLIDDTNGGVMDKNGGPHESYPHHGRYFTFWNYVHQASSDKTYDFWSVNSRNGNTYAEPYFIGFQPDTHVDFVHEGLNQLPGQAVEPKSLFEAQLDFRMTNPQVRFLSPSLEEEIPKEEDLIVEISALDPDGEIANIVLYLDDQQLRSISSAPFVWGEGSSTDLELKGLSAGVYTLKAVAMDNEGNVISSIKPIVIGAPPEVSITTPQNASVNESNEPLRVEAIASDTDGTLSSASLYLQGELVREVFSQPFIWGTDVNLDPELFELSSGTYQLSIVVTDDDGLTSKSEVSVTMNHTPEVNFGVPLNEQYFVYGDEIRVELEASDLDNDLESVILYIDDEIYEEKTSLPYTFILSNDSEQTSLKVGSHELRATAVDAVGVSVSEEISITIEEVLSMDKIESNAMVIYPNPFFDSLQVEAHSMSEVKLVDAIGGIQHLEVTREEDEILIFNTSLLDPGMYFLRVKSAGIWHTHKVVKH